MSTQNRENLEEPTFTMLHTGDMPQTHWPLDFRDDFKGFYLTWAWWPSWSSDHKAMEILIRFGPGQISSKLEAQFIYTCSDIPSDDTR